MPQFDTYTTKTKRLVLPSTAHLPSQEQAWVEFRKDVLAGDIEVMDKLPGEDMKLSKLIPVVTRMLVDWNFTEKDNSKTPITEDAVRNLKIEDLNAVSSAIWSADPVTDEDKKKLQDTSSEQPTEQQ